MVLHPDIPNSQTELAEGSDWITAAVQPSVHGMEAIVRAAHRFTGAYHVDIQNAGADLVHVRLKAKAGRGSAEIGDEFRNELIDEGLRAIVARDSRQERDLILAHALSRHPVLHAEYETAEPFSDPFSLLQPDNKR